MLNDKPCDACEHFDPVLRGTNKGLRSTAWGWCAKHSIYPTKEGPGQLFPVGVKRMTDAALPAKPKIVLRGEVVTNCTLYKVKRPASSKEDLLSKLKKQQGGRLA